MTAAKQKSIAYFRVSTKKHAETQQFARALQPAAIVEEFTTLNRLRLYGP